MIAVVFCIAYILGLFCESDEIQYRECLAILKLSVYKNSPKLTLVIIIIIQASRWETYVYIKMRRALITLPELFT